MTRMQNNAQARVDGQTTSATNCVPTNMMILTLVTINAQGSAALHAVATQANRTTSSSSPSAS